MFPDSAPAESRDIGKKGAPADMSDAPRLRAKRAQANDLDRPNNVIETMEPVSPMKITGRRPIRSDLSRSSILMPLTETAVRLQTTPVEYEKHLHKGKDRILEHFKFGYRR